MRMHMEVSLAILNRFRTCPERVLCTFCICFSQCFRHFPKLSLKYFCRGHSWRLGLLGWVILKQHNRTSLRPSELMGLQNVQLSFKMAGGPLSTITCEIGGWIGILGQMVCPECHPRPEQNGLDNLANQNAHPR